MSNSFGSRYRFTIFGQSHAPAIGVTIEGLPAGFAPDMEALGAFLARRAPGQGPYSTPRKEADRPEFIAGLVDGHTCGAPVTAVIYNTNTRSGDYENLRRVPRPGHADYTAWVKYGDARDVAGGGQFSGRLTAPLCIAGGLALQLLEREGVSIRARILSIGGETEPEKMRAGLDAAKAAGDSLGGVIECVCEGVPAGLGEPMFGGMENRISQAVFAIPAVKGIEFGAGFAAAGLTGSQNNDPFYYDASGVVRTRTNNHGGILGGITSGMPIVFRAAVKPTPSIGIEQDSVDLTTGESVKLTVSGRHDPCIVPRAVPCMEAAAACAIYDALLENNR
ncbi:MAG: chorismate synthase [Oscillospiraceae bacterium]|nr:chorismate synthase [Oscillospiraceae bacterium]